MQHEHNATVYINGISPNFTTKISLERAPLKSYTLQCPISITLVYIIRPSIILPFIPTQDTVVQWLREAVFTARKTVVVLENAVVDVFVDLWLFQIERAVSPVEVLVSLDIPGRWCRL